MPQIYKASAILLLSSLLIAPLASCTAPSTTQPSDKPAVSRPDDGRIRDNTDVFKGNNNAAVHTVATAVEGFYKEVGSTEVRSELTKLSSLSEAEKSKGLNSVYQNASAYAYKGTASDASMYALFGSMSKNFEHLNKTSDYGITVDVGHITVKGNKATVDTIASTDMIDGKPSLISAERANIIQMIEIDGEWYIDVPGSIESLRKVS